MAASGRTIAREQVALLKFGASMSTQSAGRCLQLVRSRNYASRARGIRISIKSMRGVVQKSLLSARSVHVHVRVDVHFELAFRWQQTVVLGEMGCSRWHLVFALALKL